MVIEFLTPKQLSSRWRLKIGHLANLRSEKRGPKPDYVGNAVIYLLCEVERYEKLHPEILQKRARVPYHPPF